MWSIIWMRSRWRWRKRSWRRRLSRRPNCDDKPDVSFNWERGQLDLRIDQILIRFFPNIIIIIIKIKMKKNIFRRFITFPLHANTYSWTFELIRMLLTEMREICISLKFRHSFTLKANINLNFFLIINFKVSFLLQLLLHPAEKEMKKTDGRAVRGYAMLC